MQKLYGKFADAIKKQAFFVICEYKVNLCLLTLDSFLFGIYYYYDIICFPG